VLTPDSRPTKETIVPTYEYACTDCGQRLEVVQSFSDANLTVCPECEGRLRKVFSPVGVVFKGSGFYKTDSRKAGSHGDKPAKTETSSASKTESKSESSTTSSDKPAKTTESKPTAAAS
jgi:putative FmdB family regulatory protein